MPVRQRRAAGGAGARRGRRCGGAEKSARDIHLNGDLVQSGGDLASLLIEPTGSWQMWKDVTLPIKVRLKKGDNVLRLTAVSGGLNLDEIRLRAAD